MSFNRNVKVGDLIWLKQGYWTSNFIGYALILEIITNNNIPYFKVYSLKAQKIQAGSFLDNEWERVSE